MRYAILLLCAACVSPSYQDCALTCGAENACPSGLLCDSQGWCRVGVGGPACGTSEPDAAPSEPDAAPVGVCQTSTQCAPLHTCVDGACHTNCDPISRLGCSSEQTCILFFRPGLAWTDCEPAGPKARDDTCAQDSECGLGLSCPDDMCEPYCRRMGGDTCGMGSKCHELAPGDVRLGSDKIGFCAPD